MTECLASWEGTGETPGPGGTLRGDELVGALHARPPRSDDVWRKYLVVTPQRHADAARVDGLRAGAT